MSRQVYADAGSFDLPPPIGLTRRLLLLYGSIWVVLVVLTTWTPGSFVPKVVPISGPGGPSLFPLADVLALHPPGGGVPGGPGFHFFQLLTSHFVHQPKEYLGTFFTLLGIYFFARPVEDRLGSRGLLGTWIAAAIGAVLGACLFGVVQHPVTSHAGVAPGVLALLVVFCGLIPNAVVRLFFVVPIQARWLGVISALFTVLAAFAMPEVVGGWEVGGLAGGWAWWRYGGRRPRTDDERAKKIVERIQRFQVIEGGKSSGPTWH